MGRAKRIWYLSPMRAAKVQASLRIRAVSPEPPLLAHTSSESRGTFRQKARSLALWMARHAQLKFVMTECLKTQIRLMHHICWNKRNRYKIVKTALDLNYFNCFNYKNTYKKNITYPVCDIKPEAYAEVISWELLTIKLILLLIGCSEISANASNV